MARDGAHNPAIAPAVDSGPAEAGHFFGLHWLPYAGTAGTRSHRPIDSPFGLSKIVGIADSCPRGPTPSVGGQALSV